MSDLDFYFGMNVLKGFSLLALLGIIITWALQPPEPAVVTSEGPSRFALVGTDSGFYNIHILRDNADGRCWASYGTSRGIATLGPIPCE